MKIQKKLDSILFPVVLVIIPLAAIVYGYAFSVHTLENVIYKYTAGQVLTNGVTVISPKKMATITAPLSVEYISWSPVVAHKTAAKK